MTGWSDKYLDPGDEELFDRIADATFGPNRGSGPAVIPGGVLTSRTTSRNATLTANSTSRTSSTSRTPSTCGNEQEAPELHGAGLRAWDADESFVADVLALPEFDAPIRVRFPSVIPGSDKREALVECGQDGQFFYRDIGGAAFTLAEAFASVVAGGGRLLRRPEAVPGLRGSP